MSKTCTNAVFFFLALLIAQLAGAESLKPMRRWVVFPFAVEKDLQESANAAWWKMRERLTEKKRFLVASKQFMAQKEAFEPRTTIKEDSIEFLCRTLDADILVTGFVENRKFTLQVYVRGAKKPFWSRQLSFAPSLPAPDQMETISERMTQELLARIPYQGVVITDPLIGQSVFEESGKKLVLVDIGINKEVDVGAAVHFLRVDYPIDTDEASLLGEAKTLLIGEGRVVALKREVAVVELLRAESVETIAEKTLVRFPEIAERWLAPFVTQGLPRLSPELILTEIKPVQADSEKTKRHTLVWGSILSILGILALAL